MVIFWANGFLKRLAAPVTSYSTSFWLHPAGSCKVILYASSFHLRLEHFTRPNRFGIISSTLSLIFYLSSNLCLTSSFSHQSLMITRHTLREHFIFTIPSPRLHPSSYHMFTLHTPILVPPLLHTAPSLHPNLHSWHQASSSMLQLFLVLHLHPSARAIAAIHAYWNIFPNTLSFHLGLHTLPFSPPYPCFFPRSHSNFFSGITFWTLIQSTEAVQTTYSQALCLLRKVVD